MHENNHLLVLGGPLLCCVQAVAARDGCQVHLSAMTVTSALHAGSYYF